MAKAKLKVDFGSKADLVPSSTRSSKYQELYDLLQSNPGQWADVTDAITALAEQAGGKTPTPQAAAITLRKQGFEATTRQVEGEPRVFAAFEPQEEGEQEQSES